MCYVFDREKLRKKGGNFRNTVYRYIKVQNYNTNYIYKQNTNTQKQWIKKNLKNDKTLHT